MLYKFIVSARKIANITGVGRFILPQQVMPRRSFFISSKLTYWKNHQVKLFKPLEKSAGHLDCIPSSSFSTNSAGTCTTDTKRILKIHATANLYFQNNFHWSGQIRDLSAEELQESQNPEQQNVFKLEILLNKASEILRLAFTTKWNLMNSKRWEDTKEDRQQFIKTEGLHLYYNSNCYYFQKCLHSKPIAEWSLFQLIECVECLDADVNYDVCKELLLVKHSMYSMTEEKYHEYWKKISILLFELDVPSKEIDEFKPPNIYESSQIDPKAKDLIFLADKVLDEGRQKDSIEYCTRVLYYFDIPYAELSKLYFKRSKAYTQLGNIISAKKDADRAVYFSNLVQKMKD